MKVIKVWYFKSFEVQVILDLSFLKIGYYCLKVKKLKPNQLILSKVQNFGGFETPRFRGSAVLKSEGIDTCMDKKHLEKHLPAMLGFVVSSLYVAWNFRRKPQYNFKCGYSIVEKYFRKPLCSSFQNFHFNFEQWQNFNFNFNLLIMCALLCGMVELNLPSCGRKFIQIDKSWYMRVGVSDPTFATCHRLYRVYGSDT